MGGKSGVGDGAPVLGLCGPGADIGYDLKPQTANELIDSKAADRTRHRCPGVRQHTPARDR